ncbi:MAG: P-II family nitrogen regulator [Actinomycetales bacterium]
MKLVTAVVQPHRWPNVFDSLKEAGVNGLTVCEVQGMGRQRGHSEVYRGAEYETALNPKLRVEIVADDDDVETVVNAVMGAAATGRIGDGKVWIQPLDSVVRVRTGEVGFDAI